MHENDKYPGVPERIQLMDENGTVHEHPTFSRYVKDVDGDTLREQGYADDAFFEEVAESAQKVASGVRDAVLSAEVADFEHFFDRVYAQEHQQVEDDREFYRTYNAGFEEE